MRSLGINWSKSLPSSFFIIHYPLRPQDKPGKERETIYLMLATSQLSQLSKASKSSSCSISCFNVDLASSPSRPSYLRHLTLTPTSQRGGTRQEKDNSEQCPVERGVDKRAR